MVNNMKNKAFIFLFLTTVVAIALYFVLKPTSHEKKVIAIVTTLSHPALDRARSGFISGIKAKLPEVLLLDFNAEGNMQQANMIARQIAQNPHVVGIFAIATLAAQTLAKAEKTRPIVVAAVSDPEAIGPAGSSKNICGLTDAIDPDFQINAVLDLLPDIKSIALLYSPHEANSAAVVKKLKVSAEARNLRVETVGVYEPQQIASASFSACQKGDAVLIPLDNTLAAAMPAVMKATKQLPCPIIISDEVLIKHGAAIAFGVDYQKSGEEAAVLMADILNHQKTPAEIGFINPNALGLYLNKRVVEEKNITINPHAHSEIIIFQGDE